MLDEPTNYLDFDALDIVEEALRAFDGTLVMVTHDAYFAERVGWTRRWEVGGGSVSDAAAEAAAKTAAEAAHAGPEDPQVAPHGAGVSPR